MKLFLMSFLVSVSLLGVESNEKEMQLEQYVEEVAVPKNFSSEGLFLKLPETTFSLNPMINLATIINLGKMGWMIVEKGKPALNVKYHYANALPRGVNTSEDLDGFSELHTRAFHVWARNGFGIRVYDLVYVGVHRSGGNYQGRGQYIENAAVIPQNIEVAWGYTLNFGVSNVNTVNVGTKEDPIASLILETEFSVSTPLKKQIRHEAFEFRGDSPTVRVMGR